MREAHGGEDMQAMHFVLAFELGGGEHADGAKAGVVDEQVEIRGARDAFLDAAEIGIVRQIGDEDFSGRWAEFGSDLPERVLAPCDEYQVVAACGERPRKRRTDAAGRAGDECNRTGGLHSFTVRVNATLKRM